MSEWSTENTQMRTATSGYNYSNITTNTTMYS